MPKDLNFLRFRGKKNTAIQNLEVTQASEFPKPNQTKPNPDRKIMQEALLFSQVPTAHPLYLGISQKDLKEAVEALPAYSEPPAGAKIFYAYGMEPGVVDDLYSTATKIFESVRSVSGVNVIEGLSNFSLEKLQASMGGMYGSFNELMEVLQKTPGKIKEYYNKLSKEEKAFVKLISSSMAQHHFSQLIMSTLQINPLTLAILSLMIGARKANAQNVSGDAGDSISADAGNDADVSNAQFCETLADGTKTCQTVSPSVAEGAGASVSPFVFHDGIPPNDTNLCKPTVSLICDQFYVSQAGKTVLRGYAKFFVMDYPAGKTPQPQYLPDVIGSWPCGDRNHTKAVLQSIFEDPKVQPKLGPIDYEQWSFAYPSKESYDSAYATVTISNRAIGLSSQASQSLQDKIFGPITRCMADNIPHPKFKMPPWLIAMITVDAALGLCALGCGAYILHQKRNNIKEWCKRTTERCCPGEAAAQPLLAPV